MKRDQQLIRKLLLKLEDYPSNLGDVFVFSGAESELAIEGYSSDEITYHLEQLREMGLIDSPGSQPMLGVIFAGLTPKGHDLADQFRDEAAKAPPNRTPASEEPMSDTALMEIRQAIAEIRSQLPTIVTSNALRVDIEADIVQTSSELDRPTPRRKFLKTFLESLRDNLAKAAATGLVAGVAAILGKYFHLF